MAAAGGPRPVVAADIGYGDNALFRQQLTAAGWQYAVAVKGSTTAHDGDAVPQARPYGGRGQPPKPAYPGPPTTLRQLALAHAAQARPVTWRQGTKASKDNPAAAMTSCFLAIRVRPAGRHITRAADRSLPACWLLAEWPPEAGEPSGYWLSTLPEDTPSKNSSGWPRSDMDVRLRKMDPRSSDPPSGRPSTEATGRPSSSIWQATADPFQPAPPERGTDAWHGGWRYAAAPR